MTAPSVRMPPVTAADATAELLFRAKDGDGTAWEVLVTRFSGLLWSVARAHRLDEAEAADVVQTTWLRLLENVDRVREPERLAGWLATTARRESLRSLGKTGRVSFIEHMEAYDAPDDVAEPLDAGLLREERDAQLWAAFTRLAPSCQALLRLLVATPDPSYQDVAAALGRPVGSIGPTRARCLKRLRSALEAVESGRPIPQPETTKEQS